MKTILACMTAALLVWLFGPATYRQFDHWLQRSFQRRLVAALKGAAAR